MYFFLSLILQLIHVIDRFEDEVEAHAYEDLVPLDVKLALEDKVFGWTHLTSSFLGHVAFTVGSYYLVYELVTLMCDHELCFEVDKNPSYYNFLRGALAFWAAFSSYRMVRRRRRVWFRAAYGSRAYKKDAARRRTMVEETDRTTTLGRMLLNFKERRVMKKLRKAENRFAQKHKMTMESQRAVSTPIEEDRKMTASELQVMKRSFDSADEASSEEEFDSPEDDLTVSTVSTAGTGKMARRPSFHTDPTNRMQSVAHDQILFETIQKMPYAHGGFFGAAPFMLANPHWISILRHLMPDVYVEISRRVVHAPASRLIHWAENNPIVAAYGAAHELEYSYASHIPNIEWDVFLDPYLVNRVQVVLNEREKYYASLEISGKSRNSRSARHILGYYEQELKRRSQTLVDKMLIAHGSATTLIMEQTGFAKPYIYSRVKRTRKILGGGIYARQWLAVFAEALKLGTRFEESGSPTSTPKKLTQKHSLTALADSKCPDMNMLESIKMVSSIVKKDKPLGLVLDVKSRHVPKRIWSIVIDTLRTAGVRVEGIASFFCEDIRGVSQLCTSPVQEILFFHSAGDLQRACHDGKIEAGDKIFFNAGALLWEPGAYSLGSQIRNNFDPEDVKKNYRILPLGKANSGYPGSTIEMYKNKYKLSIGMYCQEFAIDETAIDLVARFVNSNKELFDLGLSWGGVNGITIKGISPGRFTSTDGFWNQRYIGEIWNYNLRPESMDRDKLRAEAAKQ
jgi:hypothetical protein